MDREEARAILNKHINSPLFTELPVVDERIIIQEKYGKFAKRFKICDYTFRYLLCIAYDLQDANGTDQEV